MNAVAQRHPSPSDEQFVGQVLKRSSPVLTWRPALAARLREEEMEAKSVPAPHESSVRLSLSRFSKLTTRRMEALPVVRKVARSTGPRAGAWSVTVRVLLGAIVGSLLAVLAILFLDARGGASAKGPFAIKESSAQAYDAPMDLLAAAPAAPAAPAAIVEARAPIAPSTHKATASAAHAAPRAHATHATPAHAARAHRTPAKHR